MATGHLYTNILIQSYGSDGTLCMVEHSKADRDEAEIYLTMLLKEVGTKRKCKP